MKNIIIIFSIFLFISCKLSTNIEDKTNVAEHTEQVIPNYNVALHFINDYVDYCNNSANEMSFVNWINNRKDVTISFKKELQRIIVAAEKEEPELGLGFDPILDAQDFPNQFEIDTTDGIFVIVKGVDWLDFKLTLKLKNDFNEWLVDGSGIINIPENKRMDR